MFHLKHCFFNNSLQQTILKYVIIRGIYKTTKINTIAGQALVLRLLKR